ncbi:hypothetical protein TVAG_091920 [Trichomonas vaginalis G3]|uniref:Uncharacterized protein n=1 Tax=Trichomonas vaginalis (strain ATCC PRA-98 / G3) TaxID=412133 RepID=A2FN57_TRIV3|nr:hypothetical protein TVAGG3_0585320 [Trichomonas vaginalis G3]EAX93657.1 hypothetical protein TVAG_091920 [Trichomonas vaginalis G3]KAI5522845.1 hypothetical protein TVAGG3_0585320 [Trichomonas vaginalis G3]|eukprot:XP_001306587.1 hypothetical protein [Trichomonas vaginalis G3]
MIKRPGEPEPKSWAELLKQEEARRNAPPDKSFYVREKIKQYQDGGIFGQEPEPNEEYTKTKINCDSHFYATDNLFDPPEEVKRKVKPSNDHGLDLLSWNGKKGFKDEAKPRQMREITPSYENTEFDSVTGVAKTNAFKNSITQILKQRERSEKIMATRSIDPISNTFPTANLEATRAKSELDARTRTHEFKLSRVPPNERRAMENTVNIVTGETTDEKVANEFVKDFSSSCERNKKSIAREKEIVEQREKIAARETERIGCRYNLEGRQKDLRDYNLITGQDVQVCMDKSVKMKPSVWQWCQTEALQ